MLCRLPERVRALSVLDDVLREEHERAKKIRKMMQTELDQLPKEYISRKNIRGNVVCYLQKREADKIVSRYIPKSDEELWGKKIERRRQLQASIRDLNKSISQLKKVLR